MQKTITALPNQTVADIVLTAYGTLEALMPFCKANDVGPTDVPDRGTVFTVPDVVDDATVPTNTGVLKYLERSKTVIGTAAISAAPPLALRVILYPHMDTLVGTDGSGLVFMEYHPTTLFEHYYHLQEDWDHSAEGLNVLKSEMLNPFLAGGGLPGSPASMPSLISPMSSIHVHWEGLPMPAGSAILITWGNLGIPPSALTFKDVMGNQARVSPLMFVYSIPFPAIMQYVLPKIEVELVSTDGITSVIRFRRFECPIPGLFGFVQAGLAWVTTVPFTPDPADPLNNDKIIITVPAGVYKMGVMQKIAEHTTGIPMPQALIEMVVEVY